MNESRSEHVLVSICSCSLFPRRFSLADVCKSFPAFPPSLLVVPRELISECASNSSLTEVTCHVLSVVAVVVVVRVTNHSGKVTKVLERTCFNIDLINKL